MPGKHITLDRVAKYRSAREKWSRPDAARMALISIGSARRIDQGTHYGLRSAVARPSACRTSKLAMIWSDEASPYIAAHPDARAKTVFVHLLEQAQDGGSLCLLLIGAASNDGMSAGSWKGASAFKPIPICPKATRFFGRHIRGLSSQRHF
jgi:hypothetical protein